MSDFKSSAKRSARKALVGSVKTGKKLAAKNKHTRKLAGKVRRVLLEHVSQHEIYDFHKQYPTIADYHYQQTAGLKTLKKKPLISIVMPTYNTPVQYLRECIESVQLQSYPNWELCIADDASPNKDVVATIQEYSKQDKRIKLVERKQNGHISVATNSAIEIAKGEYIALLDHDDVLWPNALFELAKVINEHSEVDFIYTDEDKIDEKGQIHSYPFFKPDWSPEFLESCNYITHFSCLKRSLVDQIGGFRKGYEGAQDWDLFIRAAEVTDKIYHIPKVLYSWRVHEASTAHETDSKPYVYDAQKKLLQDHLARTGLGGEVHPGIIPQHSVIEYEVKGTPSVTVLLYGAEANAATESRLLENCGYRTEFVKIEHVPALTPQALASAVAACKDEYIVLLPAGLVTISDRWLYKFLADGQRDGIGIVGGRLVSSDQTTLESAGIAPSLGDYFLPLLQGEPLDDNHYMRALHGKSRRNVAAVEAPLLVRTKALKGIDLAGLQPACLVVDLCLSVVEAGHRCVYSPYISASPPDSYHVQLLSDSEAETFNKKWAKYRGYDPYVNPNYSKANGKLEVQ